MLTQSELMRIATKEMIQIFGKQYLRDNYEITKKFFCFIDDGKTYMFFIGIKGEYDLPGRKGTFKDWVVYGYVRIDAETGAVTYLDYGLE